MKVPKTAGTRNLLPSKVDRKPTKGGKESKVGDSRSHNTLSKLISKKRIPIFKRYLRYWREVRKKEIRNGKDMGASSHDYEKNRKETLSLKAMANGGTLVARQGVEP